MGELLVCTKKEREKRENDMEEGRRGEVLRRVPKWERGDENVGSHMENEVWSGGGVGGDVDTNPPIIYTPPALGKSFVFLAVK